MGWGWDCVVFLFPDTFRIKWILSFPLFPDTSTELSAAGARRGVSNCIQTTILLGPSILKYLIQMFQISLFPVSTTQVRVA